MLLRDTNIQKNELTSMELSLPRYCIFRQTVNLLSNNDCVLPTPTGNTRTVTSWLTTYVLLEDWNRSKDVTEH